MMNTAVVILGVICNFILYLSFGSLITGRIGLKRGERSKAGSLSCSDEACPLMVSVVTGFFFQNINI